MSTATVTTKKTTKKTTTKKSAAKNPTAKKKTTSKKTTPKKATPKKRGKSLRLQVFELLEKHVNGLGGPTIQQKLEVSGVPACLKHEWMRDDDQAKRIKCEKHEESRGVIYIITAAGKKAIKDGTVDSKPAPSSIGRSELRS